MTFVFYDTETTGLDAAFDQILQFAAIVTGDDFNILEELNLRCRLQPHIVPSPGAIRVTRVGPHAIQAAPLSFYEMVKAIRKFIDRWTPATFIGFNSIDFDEKMLRGALYQTLHPVYLTNTNGNSRLDVLRLAHAVAGHRPEAIAVPHNEKGKPTFKLAALVQANGLALDQAHEVAGLARCHPVDQIRRPQILTYEKWPVGADNPVGSIFCSPSGILGRFGDICGFVGGSVHGRYRFDHFPRLIVSAFSETPCLDPQENCGSGQREREESRPKRGGIQPYEIIAGCIAGACIGIAIGWPYRRKNKPDSRERDKRS